MFANWARACFEIFERAPIRVFITFSSDINSQLIYRPFQAKKESVEILTNWGCLSVCLNIKEVETRKFEIWLTFSWNHRNETVQLKVETPLNFEEFFVAIVNM